jgi:hypothetical protein
MADLESVLQQLHDSEINAGVQTFFDAGMRVWIGDEMNGIRTGRARGLPQRGSHEVVSGVHGETRSNSPPELRSVCTKRSSLRAVPWTRSPVSMSSISIILPLLRPAALMACTRNLPSQMNHDTTI